MPTYSEDDEYEDEYDDELQFPHKRSVDRRSPTRVESAPQDGRKVTSLRGATPRKTRSTTIHRTPYPERGYPTSLGRSISAVIGGVLLILAIVGFAWFWNYKQAPVGLRFIAGLPGWTQGHIPTGVIHHAPTTGTVEQAPALAAAGITLEHPSQQAPLSQQQALLIASQLEPEAAANAQSTTSQFVLVSTGVTLHPTLSQPALNHVPAWMILYQGIPLQPNDASADPTPSPHSSHNLYVFLNATTGKELLAIWI